MAAPDDDHVCQDIAGARVHASPDLSAEARDAIGQVVQAARERYASERAPVLHTLATVARGGPLYPPVEVTLTSVAPDHVRIVLRLPGTQRAVEWVPSAELVDDPCRLGTALEAMLRSLVPL